MAADLNVFALEAEALAQILDTMDYFEVLKLARTATPGEIKAAYYRGSRDYHPDKIFHTTDEALKAHVHTVYKRITEAYSVLRDDQKRNKYLADVSGPDRAAKLRYTEATEQEAKKAKEEEIGKTPNGRKFYNLGAADLSGGRFEAAERNFKMALMYEAQNAIFKQKLEEAQKKIKPKPITIGGK